MLLGPGKVYGSLLKALGHQQWQPVLEYIVHTIYEECQIVSQWLKKAALSEHLRSER